MALQSSGAISLSQIANEFGLPSSKRLGAYRVSETYGALTNIPLDTGVPQSGTIRFSDFYNKKLNIIVDGYSGTPATPPATFHFDSVSAIGRASIPLYTYQTNPSLYPADAPITSPDFVSRYGVSPFNLRNSAVINNPNPEGNFTWVFSSVSLPADGNYRIKSVVDDTATIAIGSYLLNAGFGASAVDTTVFLNAGTYNIAVSYNQGAYGSIAGGNLSYFALTIDRVIPPTSISAASFLEKLGAKNRFVNNFVYMVGGFRGKPSNTSTHKVIIHINTLVYNPTKGYKNSVAFRTGYWDSGTELIIDIGPDGRIIGAGGDGGRGGDAGSGGQRGQDGGSAMAILHPCIIRNRGYIQRGHGGGGGGNGINYTDVETYTYTVSGKKGSSTRTGTRDVPSSSPGGGGGGGAGLPIGIGAAPGTGKSGNGSAASSGQNAIQATTGPFTVPPTTSGNVRGGTGGAGGNRAGSGGNGGPPNRSAGSPGASPGDNGFAFVVWNDGTGVTLVNSGSGAVSSGDFPYLYNTVGELL